MKKLIVFAIAAAFLTFCVGCTSTVTYYDKQGNITKVEKATNFSRAMDGTNSKSQMLLIDGTYVGFEASASAGENCTPGVSVKYANGRTAVINTKKSLEGNGDTIEKFFNSELNIAIDGVTKK